MKKNYLSFPIPSALLFFLVSFFLVYGASRVNEITYEITGRLVDVDGSPVTGHPVILMSDGNRQIATGQSNDQGYFSLSYDPEATSADPGEYHQIPTGFELGSSYPNPFNPVTTIPFRVPEATHATIGVYDLLGRRLMENRAELNPGNYDIVINLGPGISQGQYLLRVSGRGYSLTRAMTFISAGVSSGTGGISLRPSGNREERPLIPARVSSGEEKAILRLIVQATDVFQEMQVQVPFGQNYDTGELVLLLNTHHPGDGVTDINGNHYRTVIIGSQEWMAENLRVSNYRNGDPIPNVVANGEWTGLSTGAWCYLNNDSANDDLYGKIYNWHAVNDTRGLCPDGWRVSTDDDWTLLSDFVGGTQVAGKKLKSRSGWYANGNGTDDFGFTALPGGGRDWEGEFDMPKFESIWWTSTEYDAKDAWLRGMYHNTNRIDRDHYIKTDGMYVRCLRVDESVGVPETKKTYHENFQTGDETGWAFIASDPTVSVQNNELRFSTSHDDLVHMLLPVEATRDDFSFRVVPGSQHEGIESGGFGRAGFKSVIAFHIEEEISVMYTEDIASHADGELTTLATYPIPGNLSSMQLDVSRNDNNMHVRAFVNDLLFYSGTVENVDEGLFAGQMVMYLHRDEEEAIPVLWSLDEVKIDYNPYLDKSSTFLDDFTNRHSPWFRTGDENLVAQSITIGNNRLNFNADMGTELNVLSPMGPVGDFALEVQGGSAGAHNADFFISRIFDYKNYISVFFDEDELFLGYAVDSYEPEILAEASIAPADVSKLRFSAEQSGADLNLQVWVDDELLLGGTIPDVPRRLASGHIVISFIGGSVVDAYLDYVVIDGMEIMDNNVVYDVDGNRYSAVVIGEQTWMAENLRVTRYSDGSPVSTGLSNADWQNATSGAVAVYPHGLIDGLNSDEEVVRAYGRLYNWHAVTDQRGLCPEGWRVSTNEDWTELVNYVGAAGYIADAGNALKSRRQVESPLGAPWATDEHPRWNSHDTTYGIDAFAFSGLPAGLRRNSGGYVNVGNSTMWWTTSDSGPADALARRLFSDRGTLNTSVLEKSFGFSVRCVQE